MVYTYHASLSIPTWYEPECRAYALRKKQYAFQNVAQFHWKNYHPHYNPQFHDLKMD